MRKGKLRKATYFVLGESERYSSSGSALLFYIGIIAGADPPAAAGRATAQGGEERSGQAPS
jgi:hypothetical protein